MEGLAATTGNSGRPIIWVDLVLHYFSLTFSAGSNSGLKRAGEPADAKATRVVEKGLIPALIRADGGLLDLHQELHIGLRALHLLKQKLEGLL